MSRHIRNLDRRWNMAQNSCSSIIGKTRLYYLDHSEILRKYKDRAEHDQKLLNIMFHFNPHLLHQLECRERSLTHRMSFFYGHRLISPVFIWYNLFDHFKSWNFKNNFCTDAGNVCNHAEEHGAGAVHGITSAFFGDVNPTFRALYEGKYRFDAKYRLKFSTNIALSPASHVIE